MHCIHVYHAVVMYNVRYTFSSDAGSNTPDIDGCPHSPPWYPYNYPVSPDSVEGQSLISQLIN